MLVLRCPVWEAKIIKRKDDGFATNLPMGFSLGGYITISMPLLLDPRSRWPLAYGLFFFFFFSRPFTPAQMSDF